MKFIKEADNRLAFKFKNEIIYLDEFLIVDNYSVSDKDGRCLYKSDAERKEEFIVELFIWNYCNDKVLFDQTNSCKYFNKIDNLMHSNYLDKIIKLFKVGLKQSCIKSVRYVHFTEGQKLINYYVQEFEGKVKTLDKFLEKSVKIKKDNKIIEFKV